MIPVVEAWIKFLANVSDKELGRYITAWEKALTRYGQDVANGGSRYCYDSTTRALSGAYTVRSKREADSNDRP
ncbi:MAG: hypothetical protein ACREHG_03450 [Candidatus Saccharimonadales bacterium]